MPTIEVPGLGPIQFPDSMSGDQIVQAIERDILPQARASRQVSEEPMGPAAPAPIPERGFLGTIGARVGDVAGSTVSGLGGIASGLGGIVGIGTGSFDNPLTRLGQSIRGAGESLMSPELIQKRQLLDQALKEAEGQGFREEVGAVVSTLAQNPGLLGSMAVEQIPQLLASFGIGRVATAAGQIAGRTGARAAAVGAERAAAEAGQRAGLAAAVGSGAGLQGGEVANQTYQDIMGLAPEVLNASPNYQALVERLSPEEARQQLATEGARLAGIMGGGISAGTMAVLPGAEKALLVGNAKRSIISRVLGTSGWEALQEGIEEGGGRASQNIAALRADVERDISRGVAGQAATGAALGAVLGGVSGAISRPEAQVTPPGAPPPPAAPPAPPASPAPPTAGPAIPAVTPPPPVPPAPTEAVPPAPPIPAAVPAAPQEQVNPAYTDWQERRAATLGDVEKEIIDNERRRAAGGPDAANLPSPVDIMNRFWQWESQNPQPPETLTTQAPEQQEAAPVVEPPASVAPPQFVSFNVPVGTQFPVITPPGPGGQTMSVDVVPEVVDLYSLTPASGRLQNRNIDAKANELLISKIANRPDFSQLTTSQYADRGAPVVGADNIVEVGNHRIAGLKKAAENNPEGFRAYVQSLQNAGYDTAGMQFPVLVRRRLTDLDENQRVRFVKAANKSASQNLGPVELAREDAEALTDQLLAKFDGTLEAGIEAAKNRGFVNDFVNAISSGNDLSDFIDAKSGKLLPDGINRINRALFAAAYNDQTLLEKSISSADDDLKSITGAMVNATPSMLALRRGVESGRIREEFNIVPDIVRASDRIRSGRDRGMTPAEVLKIEDMMNPVTPLEASIIRLMSNDNMSKVASKAAITRRLKAYAEEAATQTPDVDLVGKERRITPEQAILASLNPDQTAMFSRGRPIETVEEPSVSPASAVNPIQEYSRRHYAPIVYQDKDFAILEGIDRNGNPVYFGAMTNGQTTRDKGALIDVDKYNGPFVPEFILDRMREAKKDAVARANQRIKQNPNGPIPVGSNIGFDKSFPERLRGWTSELLKELGMSDAKIFFTTFNGTKDPDYAERNNLYGDDWFRSRRAAYYREGDYFGVTISRVGENAYTIAIKDDVRLSQQIETLAHEIGHVFDKQILKKESNATVNEVMNAFDQWLLKNKKLPTPQYIKLLRTAVVGKKIASGYPNSPAYQTLDSYYLSFSEWFADQVARWSLVSKPAESLMGRFFQKIAAAYRKIVAAMGDVGLPNQTVAKFIEDHRKRHLLSTDPTEAPMFDPVKTKGWTKKPKQLSMEFSAGTALVQAPETEIEASRAPTQPPQPPGPTLLTPAPQQPTPPPPQPKLPLGSAADFYKAVIPEAEKMGLLDKVLSVLIDKKKGESPGAAIARTTINRAAGLYNADEMASANGYTGRSAGRAMEMALTNTARVQQMLFQAMGRIDPVTGRITPRRDVKPLFTIMKDAGVKNPDDINELQVYLAALKERDLRKNGRQGFTNIPDGAVLDAINTAEAKHPNWKQTAADIDKLNNALIDWSVDTGIISKDQSQKLRDVFYTPFYRIMEKDITAEPSRSVSPRIGESFTNVASAINRELKGGESPLGDLISNIILNADSIMKAGLKNLAMKTSAEVMEFAKLGKKNLTGTKNENTITYKVNGKDIAFDVEDAALFSALAGMPRTMQNGIYNTMAKTAAIFRDFVTSAPSFIFSNLYKGKISAYVQEGQPFTTNTLAGVRDFLNASESAQNFALQTGFGGMEYGMEPRNMAKIFARKLTDEGIMKSLSKGKALSAIRQAYGKMQELSEATEMAERLKLSENLVKKGMSQEDADFQGYLLAPYSRRGTGEGWLGASMQFMMPLVPFLNAKLQTTYRLVENEKGDKRRLWTLGIPQQIFLRGLVLTAFSLMAYGLNLEDDEEKWDKIPPYMKLNYDIIPFMGNYITLPRAFEIGQVFGALPIFVLDAIRRGEGKDLAEALVEVGKNTFWMNPIPKAIDPILGAFTNYDFFRGRPLETKGEQALPVGERINRSTTKTGEALSAVVNSIFGDILSPIKAQALLDGYTGTLGASLMAGFDSILAAGGLIPGKPAGAFGDPSSMPAILANFAGMQRFYREDEQMVSRFVGDFYKIKEMTDQLVRSQNLARQARDFERLTELQGEAGLPLRLRSSVNTASEQIADLNKRIRMIERSDRDALDKANAIEPLIRRRDQVAKRVVDQARNIGAF
jgi:hypothetical protein